MRVVKLSISTKRGATAQSEILNGDNLGSIYFWEKYNTSSWGRGAMITSDAIAAPSKTVIQGILKFFNQGSSSEAVRLTLTHNGIDVNSHRILNVATPVNRTDAVNKDYADILSSGVQAKGHD